MELDLNLLFQNLAQAPDGPAVSSEGVSPYLLEHVLAPALNGQSVLTSDIDFDAFEVEDIEMLSDYYSDLGEMDRHVHRFASALSKVFPVAGTARAFC